MKRLVLFFFLLQNFVILQSQTAPSIHNFTATTIDGDIIQLSKFRGKKIMIVNTASFCGFTSQFATLQLLYKNFNRFDFEIIGFPCNDFGGQDPNSDSTIQVFCSSNYGVTFQMMSKVHIKSGDTSDIYRWLQKANLNGLNNFPVSWNFNKFLINESGELVKHYDEFTAPNDTAIVRWIFSLSSIRTSIETLKPFSNFQILSTGLIQECLEFQMNENCNEPFNYSLCNYSGQTVFQGSSMEVSDKQKIKIDVSGLKEGLYFLRVSNTTHSVFKKIVILHSL